jgi:hypothetical protein
MKKNAFRVPANTLRALQAAAERMGLPETGHLIDAAVWAFYRQEPACRSEVVSDYLFGGQSPPESASPSKS